MGRKLKNINGPWYAGIDLDGTSVGFVATDEHGEVLYHKGRPVMGARCFKEALHASEARMPRTARRRLQRARGREREMERVFAPAIAPTDPDFFVRRRMSYKLMRDDIAEDPAAAAWQGLLAGYPTLAHLDVDLMESDGPRDPRLVFWAIANHVVRRGHFLMEGNDVTSANSDPSAQVEALVRELDALGEACGEAIELDGGALAGMGGSWTARELQRAVSGAVSVTGDDIDAKIARAQAKALGDLVAGYKANMDAFALEGEQIGKISVADADALDEFLANCPDWLAPAIEAARGLYSAWRLQGLLSFAAGKTLSHNQVAQYEVYGRQLRTLKDLALKYIVHADSEDGPDEDGLAIYRDFFGGPKRSGRRGYDKVLVKKLDGAKRNMGYTAYDLNVISYEEFKKRVERLFKGTDASWDPAYIDMVAALGEHRFLRRIRTTDNSAIPYQLHAEVVGRIIEAQGGFYPWLKDAGTHILKVLTSRIPYYVGPLDSSAAPLDANGKARFAWSCRLPGHERAFVAPWNYEEHIDTDAAAEAFIRRMTGKCTYLVDEDVLPANSLIYERFRFLNELAGLRYTEDGQDWLPLDAAMRAAVVEAASDGSVMTLSRIANILSRDFTMAHPHVKGVSDAKRMTSRLSVSAWIAGLLDVKSLTAAQKSMAEDIILWNTVFEERSILKRKVANEYGDILDEDAIEAFCAKRLKGWGQLSERLLTGVWVDTARGDMCIMDVLEQGAPYGRFRGTSMNLMQALSDTELGFRAKIDEVNAAALEKAGEHGIDALPGSPALRRGVSQAMKVIEDMASVAGCAPAKVYVEVTRTASNRLKGKRSRSRAQEIEAALKALDEDARRDLDAARLLRELGMFDEKEINERLYLYFRQAGKSLYSGKPIDIARIASADYCVDRILPSSVRRDESLDNKALVLYAESLDKKDSIVVPQPVQRKMAPFWMYLRRVGLMTERKLNALMRTQISERMLKSIVGRQLTETSQECKLIAAVLEATYAGVKVVPVKAGVASSIRRRTGIPRSRKANRYYHAHDALIALTTGRFIETRAPMWSNNRAFYERIMRDIEAQERRGGADSELDFFSGGFFRDLVDYDTAEVLWDSVFERERLVRACSWKNLRVTFAPYEEGGAFWKQTVYSPRDSKTKLIPVKGDRDAALFGGYSAQTFAYFMIYESEGKRGNQYRFAPVPTSIASKATDSLTELYARSLCRESGERFVRVVRDRILKETVYEAYGERFRVKGQKTAGPVRQLALDAADTRLLRIVERMVDGEQPSPRRDLESDAKVLCRLWARLLALAPANFPRVSKVLKLADLKTPDEVFSETEAEDLAKVVRAVAESEIQVVELLSGIRGTADVRPLGGSAFAGTLSMTFDKIINDPEAGFAIVDISAAGLRERVSRLG